jgi:hypothetical protein
MKIKSRWNKRAKPQTIEDIAGALGFISWKIAGNAVLELENKGYETTSNNHRLDIIGEFLTFLLQVADRLAYEQMDDDKRQTFIVALAQHMANTFAENKKDLLGEGEHRQSFIDLINTRAEDYAELSFNNGEAGFDFLRYFGEQVEALMKEKHFTSQQIMDVEAPDAIRTFKKAMTDLFN